MLIVIYIYELMMVRLSLEQKRAYLEYVDVVKTYINGVKTYRL
jgi:hypothetical protein